MSALLKEFMGTMGTGPKSSNDLNYTQAREAMESLLDESLNPTTFGAFAVAERWKGQSVDELAGFLDQLKDQTVRHLDPDRNFYLDVSGRFDGKVRSVNTDLPASVIAVAAGVPVFTHSGRDVPTQEGTTLLDVLDELGLPPNPSLNTSEKALDEIGLSYSAQSVYAPELAAVRPLRRHLGVRCFLNTIESMLNPANAPVHVGSFYHLSFASRVCETFEHSEHGIPERVVMIQGIEGQTELRSGDCLIAKWTAEGLEDREVDSREYGLEFDRDDLEEIGPTAEKSAELMERLLNGEQVPEPYRESVLWNTGIRLMAGEEVESLGDGLKLAKETLSSGSPKKIMEDLRRVFDRE